MIKFMAIQLQLTPDNAQRVLPHLTHQELVAIATKAGIHPIPPEKFSKQEIATAIMLNVLIDDPND